MPYNIEKSAHRRGEYVGHAAGLVWQITKSKSSFGSWQARPMAHTCGDNVQLLNTIIYAFRLSDLSDKLSAFNA